MKRVENTLEIRVIFWVLVSLYLAGLFTLTLYPRPILETGSASAIAEYLRAHANYFYKILYADSRIVAVGNFLMFTPLVVIVNRIYPQLKSSLQILMGVLVSAVIELSQHLIPGRVADLVDLGANTASVLVGIFIVRLLQQKTP